MEEKAIKVIIVDDHPVVLQGFEYMLNDVEGIHFSGKFSDVQSMLSYIKLNEVDIVLLDINLPDYNGIDACVDIKKINEHIKVIAISNINEFSIIRRMLDSGASGYILKNADAQEVILGIQNVTQGETALSKSIQIMFENHKSGDLPIVTRREKEVLTLLATGLNSTEIGEKIFISPLTVESHRRNLLQKFKVNNVAALIHKATEMKYI